jgi:hypothetical protein
MCSYNHAFVPFTCLSQKQLNIGYLNRSEPVSRERKPADSMQTVREKLFCPKYWISNRLLRSFRISTKAVLSNVSVCGPVRRRRVPRFPAGKAKKEKEKEEQSANVT